MCKFCTGCSTRTTCACMSRRPCISAAAARANGSAACCRVSVKRRRGLCWRSAGRSRCAATSATAPTCSTQWTLRSCSTRAPPATAAARCTEVVIRTLAAASLICTAAAGNCAAASADTPFYLNTFERTPSTAAVTAVGRALFLDASLSASGRVACATCHDPKRAFGPENDSPVQRGGSDGRKFGVRAAPSLKYTQNVPPFTAHYYDDEGDDGIDQGPA